MSGPSALDELLELAGKTPVVRVFGAQGSFVSLVAARLAAQAPLVVVTADEETAADVARGAAFFLGDADLETATLPVQDTSPYAEVTPDRTLALGRLAMLHRLASSDGPRLLALSAASLARRVIPKEGLLARSQTIAPEDEVDRDEVVRGLLDAGYTRVTLVQDAGTFAVRGGVLDVFSPLYGHPARVELWGDSVESIRLFDASTQRTTRAIEALELPPVREAVKTEGARLRESILAAADASHHPTGRTRHVIEAAEAGEDFMGIENLVPAYHGAMRSAADYLGDRLWLVIDPPEVRQAVTDLWEEAGQRYAESLDDHRLALPPGEHFAAEDDVAGCLERTTRVEVHALETLQAGEAPAVRFHVHPNHELVHELTRARSERADELLAPLARRIKEGKGRVALVASSRQHAARLVSLLGSYGARAVMAAEAGVASPWDTPRGAPHVFLGELEHGFETPDHGLLVVTEDEIFGPRVHRPKPPKKRTSLARAFSRGQADFSDLEVGEHLVHTQHGVGRYLGLAKLPMAGVDMDFVHLEYTGGSLYLPVVRLSEVSRFQGAEGQTPRLDRLGGQSWDKTRRKVRAEVKKLAEDLLKIYAQRRALPGHAYPPQDELQTEFEATFPFEETPDQQQAIDDVMGDMDQPRPMDRIVCGDVGYGKTEVALRAAFRAAMAGKQVAILAPTTVLVEQHGQTLRQRFAGWPIEVDTLSRFSPRKQSLDVLSRLASGKLDVVVGTHRLLSKDVRFDRLGLLVVDEEQRFGVTHKERIKAFRTQVDVLTLTATPIPRTLHMALMGLREVSVISTPPVDRLAVRTYVSRPNDDVVREAITKELARGGQSFLVCHRIEGSRGQGVNYWAKAVKRLVPEARVAVAHGQMPPTELEKVMVDFVAHRFDVLVCTTIIESGLDIPRANTMLVNRADQFGLAQLYQLRGRIGRSRLRAFCYLMIPPEEALSSQAKARLSTLQRYTELGSGFKIASHDLEIRGAGELLGPHQSGHVAQVGFEQYATILEEAVAELKGEPLSEEHDPELTTDLPAYLPDDLVPDTGQRLDLYKRLSSARDADTIAGLVAEIEDRFGAAPEPVQLLGELMALKAQARALGALAVDVGRKRLILTFGPKSALSPEAVAALVADPSAGFRLTPDGRLGRNHPDAQLSQPLAASRDALLVLERCAKSALS